MCKLLQGAGIEAEENSEAAEEVLEARGSKAAFESALDAECARVGS
jgi:hypothetical protein